MTPITVYGFSSKMTLRPTTFGSPPNSVCHHW
jgi:hypothetical protein